MDWTGKKSNKRLMFLICMVVGDCQQPISSTFDVSKFLTHRFRHPLSHSLIQFGEPAPIGILELETC